MPRSTTGPQARMLHEALDNYAAAERQVTERMTKADRVISQSLDALADLREQWQLGQASHDEVRRGIIKAHNDIMRAPSPFSIDQAKRRAASATATVDQLRSTTCPAHTQS